MRADHILEYSAHAACFHDMLNDTERKERKERMNDKVKLKIYLRELILDLDQAPRTLPSESHHNISDRIKVNDPNEISGGYETLRADHILEYSAHAVCFHDMLYDAEREERNERMNEELKFKIYQEMQLSDQVQNER